MDTGAERRCGRPRRSARRGSTRRLRADGDARRRPHGPAHRRGPATGHDVPLRLRPGRPRPASPGASNRSGAQPRTAACGSRSAGDADATPGPNGKPGFNGFETYGAMARARNDFNVNFGDTIYSDSEVGGRPVARTVAAEAGQVPARARARAAAAPSRLDRCLQRLGRPRVRQRLLARGARRSRSTGRACRRSSTTRRRRTAQRTGLYRSFRWGKNLELFFLDGRSFRSAKATAACDGDIAPTAPAAVRQAFATLSPALAKPVPQSCLDAIASPARTLLGAAQLAAFTKAIRASTATFKVVVNPEPLMQLYALPYDRWEGYAADRDARPRRPPHGEERRRPHDRHARPLIGEIRTETFAPGGPVGTGIWEVVTGPGRHQHLREGDRLVPRRPRLRRGRDRRVLQAGAAAWPRAALRPDRRNTATRR